MNIKKTDESQWDRGKEKERATARAGAFFARQRKKWGQRAASDGKKAKKTANASDGDGKSARVFPAKKERKRALKTPLVRG
jgi:hypothetical protein